MSGTYSLLFKGLDSASPEKVQRFKSICVADLELSIEDTQQLISSPNETRILITSESLADLTRFSELLANAGASVSIVSPPQESTIEEDLPTELTFDLEDLLGAPPPQALQSERPAKEYHLDLDSTDSMEDLSSLLADSDPTQNYQPNKAESSTLSSSCENSAAQTGGRLSLDDEIGAEDSLGHDPISQLVKDVAGATSRPQWSDSDLAFDLGNAPEELPPSPETKDAIVSDLAFDEPIDLEPPVAKKTSPEAPMPPPTIVETIAEAATPPTSSSKPAGLNLAGALDAISFETLLDGPDDFPAPPQSTECAPPSPLPSTPMPPTTSTPLPTTTPSISEVPPALASNPGFAAASNVASQPEPPQATRLTPILPEPIITKSAPDTPLPAQTVENLVISKPTSPSTSRELKEGFSKAQLGGILFAGLAVLALGNWFLSSEPEETPVPSIEATTQQAAIEAPASKSKNVAPTAASATSQIAGFSGTHSESGIDVAISATENAGGMTTRVVITTPEPPELTLEEIANQVPPRIWLKRAESDSTLLKQVGTSEWSGSLTTYIFIERGNERRRITGTLLTTIKVNPDGKSGEARIDLSYSPPGDSSLPPPGMFIEGVGKDLFRVSVTSTIQIKR